jgi:uncharacterized cupin superfamily protein
MNTLAHQITAGLRRLFAAPRPAADRLASACYRLPLPLQPDWQAGWKPYHQFKGATRNLRELACHASVLIPGHCPHDPHEHAEEELLILLAGEAELILPRGGHGVSDGRLHARPGDFVYYPAFYPHTLRAVGDRPAEYLMFKWTADGTLPAQPLGFLPMHIAWPEPDLPGHDGYLGRGLFEGPTGQLRKLHCHTSRVEPGGGYPPHVDRHDGILVILEGEVEVLGQRLGPGGIALFAAGDPHGLRNPGTVTARYLVFEFHGDWQPAGLQRLFRLGRHGH